MKVLHQFDEDVDSVLETAAKGNTDRRLKCITTIIVSLGEERFGQRKSNREGPSTRRTEQQRSVSLVLDIPMSTVVGFERKISNHLCRQLGLPRSLSNIALYGQKNKLTLPCFFFTSIGGRGSKKQYEI